jgi:predicted porin
MKKSLLALAVLGAFAGVASAQSSVTLSGGVDLAVAKKDGAYAMGTSGSSRSNFTLSGTEDLGGGMSAFFVLNHRFRPNDGTINSGNNPGPAGTTQFYRNAFVGLKGGFGDIRLGRIIMPLQDFNGGFEPWGGGDTVGSIHTGGISGTVRANNTIFYRTPVLGGFQLLAAIAAADGQLAAATPERPVGAGLRYDGGPLSLGVAWDRNTVDLETLGAYAKYAFGFGTLYAQYEKGDRIRNVPATTVPPAAAFASKEEVTRYSVAAAIPFGAVTAKIGYTDWADEDKSKVGAGLEYNLSKRTQVYTNFGKLSGNGKPGDLLTADAKKAQFDVGIWHKF